jgi:hypothetical protein
MTYSWYTVGCHDNYANSDYPGNGAIQGGNYGSRSAAFINSGNFPCGNKPGKFSMQTSCLYSCEKSDIC